jgi:hypothetical protein
MGRGVLVRGACGEVESEHGEVEEVGSGGAERPNRRNRRINCHSNGGEPTRSQRLTRVNRPNKIPQHSTQPNKYNATKQNQKIKEELCC